MGKAMLLFCCGIITRVVAMAMIFTICDLSALPQAKS